MPNTDEREDRETPGKGERVRLPGFRGRVAGMFRAAMVLAIVSILGTACSPGDNSVLNPGSNRTGLTAPPETLTVEASADRDHHALIPTGRSTILRTARTDSVEAISFFRFTDIPADTGAISAARLGLLLRGGAGSGLQVAAYEVQPDSTWSWAESADSANSVYALSLDDTLRLGRQIGSSSQVISPPTGDTVFVRGVVQLDGALVRQWARHPGLNDGFALRVVGSSPGALEFLAREGQPDSARAANPVLEYMQGDSVLAVASPAADAYLYVDRRPAEPGNLPILTIADWLPQQAIFRFPVLDSLRHRYGSQYNRVTVERAMLFLHAVAKPDTSARVAVHGMRVLSGWDESADPPTFDLISTTDARLVTESLTDPLLTLRLEAGPIIRGWVRGDRDDGIDVRSTGELVLTNRIRFYAREAADTLRPRLQVVYTPPTDPRWGSRGAR